jgi:hypothetical protein
LRRLHGILGDGTSGRDLAARGLFLYEPLFVATFVAALAALVLPARRRPLACAVLGANVIAFAFATWDVLVIPGEFDIIGDGYLLPTVFGLAGTATGILAAIALAVAALRHATPGGQVARRPGRTVQVALGCAAVSAALVWGLNRLGESFGAYTTAMFFHFGSYSDEVVVGVIVAVLAIVLALRLRSPAEGGALLVGWSVTTACLLPWIEPDLAYDFLLIALLVLTVILAAVYMRRRAA